MGATHTSMHSCYANGCNKKKKVSMMPCYFRLSIPSSFSGQRHGCEGMVDGFVNLEIRNNLMV